MTNNKNWLWVLGAVILAIALGALGMYTFGPKQLITERVETVTIEKPILIRGEATHTQTNTVQYVPKVIDPATGQLEKTDSEYQVNPPKVTVKVNGQSADFDLLTGENWKFENGKLVFLQDSTIGFNFQVPTIDNTKKRGISYGLRSDGNEAIRYDQKFNNHWGWYVGADGKMVQRAFKGESIKLENAEGGIRFSW